MNDAQKQNFLNLKENANKELTWLIDKASLVYEDDDHKQFKFEGKLNYNFAAKVWRGNSWSSTNSKTGKHFYSGVLNCGFTYYIKQRLCVFTFCVAK